MSRTRKSSKGPGYDYNGRRPGNRSQCNSPGKGVKKRTHRVERRHSKDDVRKETP